MKGQLYLMSRKFRSTTMIIATVVSLLLIFANFSLPYMIVSADDGSKGNNHEDSSRDESAHGSLYSRHNVIEAACSPGSIITTDGTYKPDIMLGCDLDDIMYAESGDDELYGEDGNDLLEGGSGADYFDCGDGLDVIIDFEPREGDTHTNNCEDVREHL